MFCGKTHTPATFLLPYLTTLHYINKRTGRAPKTLTPESLQSSTTFLSFQLREKNRINGKQNPPFLKIQPNI